MENYWAHSEYVDVIQQGARRGGKLDPETVATKAHGMQQLPETAAHLNVTRANSGAR